jgi:hypothetical protein
VAPPPIRARCGGLILESKTKQTKKRANTHEIEERRTLHAVP